jgi:phosphoglycerol transferase MdoB-like AlkP superfamily enzyme
VWPLFDGREPLTGDAATARLRWRRPLAIAALFLLSFGLMRAALLVAHRPAFADLSALQVAGGFLHGVRFDLSMTLLLAGLPLWLMALPAGWAGRPAWQRTWGWTAYVVLIVFLFVGIADLVYFPVVGRHVGSELVATLGSDREALVRMGLDYPLAIGAFAVAAAGLALTWRALLAQDESAPGRGGPTARVGGSAWGAWAIWIVLLPAFIVGIRGGLQQKPINIVNAFEAGSVAEGLLVLNAPFSVYHSTRNTRRFELPHYMSTDEAIRVVRSRYAPEGIEWTSERHPLEHVRTGDPPAPGATDSPRNVVVLVLESWDALLSDAIRTRVGLPHLGATPQFDALTSDGLLFTDFYASGQRSIEGIAALLASVPTLPGTPYLGRGMEQSRLSFLGDLARDNGYHTVFVRSAKRGSFRLDAVAALAGFDVYAGAEDILDGPSHTTAPSQYWGAWDFDSLRYLHELLIEAPGPFLGFFFGSSTHLPYPLPGEQWAMFPPGSEENDFRNTVRYVDWSLGQFLRMAREAGYYDNTLFIILADQTSAFVDAASLPRRHWIPALLVGPGIPEGEVDTDVASQMDILPTIVDYLGWPSAHASFGESLLGSRRPGALLKNGDLMLRVGREGWISHDLTRRLDGAASEAEQAELERYLLAETQLLAELLSTNRIYSGG